MICRFGVFFYPMSKLNDVKNDLELKSYPMVFNNSILICLIISPLDRIGGCVWENWKEEKEIVTYQQVNSAMLVDDIAFFPSNNFWVMARISVNRSLKKRNIIFVTSLIEMWQNPWLSICQDFKTFCSLLEL